MAEWWCERFDFGTTKILLAGFKEGKFHYDNIETALEFDKLCHPIIMLTQKISGSRGQMELNL